MVAVLTVEGLPLGCTGAESPSSSQSAAAEAAGRRRASGNRNVVDDPRKVSSAHLLSLSLSSHRAAAEDGETDAKEGPDSGLGSQHPRDPHRRHGSRAKRLSVSIMPFQETVLPLPVSQEDGGVRECVRA